MQKNTPTKKEPIKAHRGRIVYEGRGRPIGGGRPQIPRPFPGRPRPMPFPPRRRPSPFVSGPPQGGRRRPRIDPRIMFGGPRRGLGNASMTDRVRRQLQANQNAARQQNEIIQRQGLQAQRAGNKGMVVTKKAIGENDFRKGGLTLSTVDNLKKT